MSPIASRSGTKANEAAVDTPRIPIHEGFYIQIKNGKAINPGGKDEEAIGFVESWTRRNPGDPNLQAAQRWLYLKRQEVRESDEVHRDRAERAELDARVDAAAQESRLKDKATIEIVRDAIRSLHGVSKDE